MNVFSIPMRTRFRGITLREGVLFRGDGGWGEWSPFLEYPPEVLEQDVELEADLGIDSVKQTELLARAAERFGLPGAPQDLVVADLPEALEEGGEALDRRDRARGDSRCVLGAAEGGDERDALTLRERRDAGLGAVTDPSLGHVEDAAQVDRVGGVGQHAQVGQGVLDLAALVEPHAADDLVGQADADERLLEHPGLGVGAVEDRHVGGPR